MDDSRKLLGLTKDEWDLVIDALITEQAIADEQATAWKGRARESRYRREAEEIKRIRATLDSEVMRAVFR